MGVYICGYARDKGQPGRCTPGDEHCNNYCNMAPEKGPMQRSPKDLDPAAEFAVAHARLEEQRKIVSDLEVQVAKLGIAANRK